MADSQYDIETIAMITASHDKDCLFQATCAVYENADPDGEELTDEQALASACMYLRECMKDCDCKSGSAGEANGWGTRPFVSYAQYNA